MRVFFDTEFTGLRQSTSLISIGLIAENGHTFYAESNSYNHTQVDDWIRENVLANLRFTGESLPKIDLEHHAMCGSQYQVRSALAGWLAQYEHVEMWGDCLAYDWVLFCELFGGAMYIPKNVYYIPFDLATLLKAMGIDADVNREEFAGISGTKHNALHDAKAIRAVYQTVMQHSPIRMTDEEPTP